MAKKGDRMVVTLACPVCKQRVEPDFIFCPWCQTRLKRTCLRCERPLVLRWKMCPFCGTSVYGTPTPEEVTAAVATLPEPSTPQEPELVESGVGAKLSDLLGQRSYRGSGD